MRIEGQGHFFTIYFPGFVCFVLYLAKISGERLQDHWSSGFPFHNNFHSLYTSPLPSPLTFSPFLAHLSQRLIGELIGYSWSGVRPSSSSVVNNFKRLLLQNRWADQSQILCGASLGRGNDILFAASGSHDQHGSHAHIW